HRRHALSVPRQPYSSLCRTVEDAGSVLAGVKLGEHGSRLRRVDGVIAQDMALAGTVADRGDGVSVQTRLIRGSVASHVRGREQVVHVPWIRQANELGEPRVQR